MLTRAVLYGPQFRRLFPDVHLAAGVDVDLTVLSHAAHLLVAPGGVLAGSSAAELLGASCAPRGAPAEVIMLPGHQRRPCAGLRVHRDELCPDDIMRIGEIALTAPVRTAFDLARWAPDVVESVVALDSMAHHCRVRVDAVAEFALHHCGARGLRQLRDAVRLSRPGAQSPMETRVRLAMVRGGLPEPELQHLVRVDGRTFYLDMAYPHLRLAIEYDGAEHRTQQRAHHDLVREALLTRAGWTILRFTARQALHHPTAIAARVRYEVARRERALRLVTV